ncbi:DNA binding domain protein, excisionase family [Dyadobacter fermentans DSM 18053]|uniref:DNA binding domain protein, excisionase family n=2 Tax=Dyadobacter fermentans TaxID=94254 RepID=C6VVF1_DYAFD|nr:DNA binding domain protein, excisionase family [Dyadobacter fermentans DSM 18053]
MDNPFEYLARELAEVKKLLHDQSEQLRELQGVEKDRRMFLGEAAEYLGIAKPTLYAYLSKKKITHSKTGNKVIFWKSDLDAFIKGGTVEPRRKLALR